MADYYLTIMDFFGTVELVVKHSRFLGYMSYVKTRQEAEKFIESIKLKHKDASHNVSTYLLFESGVMFCTDDGEPHGTAGRPILNVLKKQELFDICVVVTRYFGGVLLGTGGLVSAYSGVCKKLIEAANLAKCVLCSLLNITIDYCNYSKIEPVFKEYFAKIVNIEFSNIVNLDLLIEIGKEENFKNCLVKKTRGNIAIKFIKQLTGRFEI